jgi:Glycosyl hydrolase family 26
VFSRGFTARKFDWQAPPIVAWSFRSLLGVTCPEPEPSSTSRERNSMRSRLVVLAAVAIAAASVAVAVTRGDSSTSGPLAATTSLPHGSASYLGVYAPGTPQRFQSVAHFSRAAGRQPNLVGYYSGWGEAFETSFAQTVHRHGAVTIVQMDPTYASVQGIAAGRYDSYLRSYADSVRHFGHPVIIGFGHEMNASWYPWGYHHVPAQTFVAAWQHIVAVFRGEGARNVTWLWTINQNLSSTGPMASWWPGARYVTWVGIDGYYFRPSSSFATVFGKTIAQVRALTSKPLLLSETGVGPIAGQSAKIRGLFAGLRQYQAVGLVWFDIAQHQGIYHQDWRIEDSRSATAAFRRSASLLTLARP